MINVTKTFLPPFDEYIAILKRAWDKVWITNHGELVQELELKLKNYLGVITFFVYSKWNGGFANGIKGVWHYKRSHHDSFFLCSHY
jgi:hypothetical protein